MKITITVAVKAEDGETLLVDSLGVDGKSLMGIVVMLEAGETTVEFVRPGQKVVIHEL